MDAVENRHRDPGMGWAYLFCRACWAVVYVPGGIFAFEKVRRLMKHWLILAALICFGSIASAITTNPASNVTADSESTPFTIPLRDSAGKFQANINTLGVDFGNPTVPSIYFSSDTIVGAWHGPYGFVVRGATNAVSDADSSQIWLQANTIRFGANADRGSHTNGLAMFGIAASTSLPDIIGNGGTSSNRNYGIYVSPTFAVSEAGSVDANVDHYGILVEGPISVSTSANSRTVRTQVGIGVGVTSSSDPWTRPTSAYSLYLDSPTWNPDLTTVYTMYVHGPSWLVDNDSYLGFGADKAGQGALRMRNGRNMVMRNAAANGDLNLIGADSGTNNIRIGTTTANAVFLEGVVSIGNIARSTFGANGNLTLPYGLVSSTIATTGTITATASNVQIQAVGTAANIGAYGSGTTYLDAMNAAGNDGLRIDNGGVITRYSSGAKGVITFPAAGGVSITGGPFKCESKTVAQLQTIVPASAGECYFCSNCENAVGATGEMVVSTGTSAGNFASAGGDVFK